MRDLVAETNWPHGRRMVRYRRHFVAGGTYFFTVVLTDRSADTLTANIGLLRIAFRHVRDERPFAMDAVVVLPDHLHAIMTLPEGDHDFPLRWRRIKTIFTQGLAERGKMRRRDGSGLTLWQRRFWEHTIRDEADFDRHTDYIHFNPVKHGYVQSPAAWPFSSIHRYVRAGVLPADWARACEDDRNGFGEPRAKARP